MVGKRIKSSKKLKRSTERLISKHKLRDESALPAGTGTRKKKIRKKVIDDDDTAYIPPSVMEDEEVSEDDIKVISFMVTPRKASRSTDVNIDDIPDKDISRSRLETKVEADTIPKDSTKTKPAFGESLQIGFKGKNSRGRRRKRPPIIKLQHTDGGKNITAGVEAEEPLTMEELKEPEPEITDVDDESYIEWDSKGSSKGSEEVPGDDEFQGRELYCRNCDELIQFKFIKYYIKEEEGEREMVRGPFCSKLCSLEFSEP